MNPTEIKYYQDYRAYKLKQLELHLEKEKLIRREIILAENTLHQAGAPMN